MERSCLVMPTMTATVNDMQNDFPKYIASILKGYEVVITDNGGHTCEIERCTHDLVGHHHGG